MGPLDPLVPGSPAWSGDRQTAGRRLHVAQPQSLHFTRDFAQCSSYVLGSCFQRRCPRLSMHHSSVVPRLPAYITHPGSDSASSLHLKPPQRQPAQHAGWPNRCNRDPAAVDMAARNTARVDLECKLVPRRLWAGPTVRESLKSPTSSLVRAASIWTFFLSFPSFHLRTFAQDSDQRLRLF